MDRREFLRLAAGTSALVLLDPLRVLNALAAAPTADSAFDLAAARRELAAHRIARIATGRLEQRFARSIGPNSQLGPIGRGGSFPICVITTDKGVVGWGQGRGRDKEAKRYIGTKVGDVFDVEAGTSDDLPQPLEFALYDLAGRILNMPVYKMIGGDGPREIYAYTGAIYFEDLMPLENPRGVQAILDACKQDYELGYRAFKIKVGRANRWMKRRGLVRDVEVTRLVREHFPNCRILVDANDGWTLQDAIYYVKEVADCQLYWIEEPFWENANDLRQLKETMHDVGCTALIADGEAVDSYASEPTAYGIHSQKFMDRLYALAEERLVDVFVMDLGAVGFTRWRKAMPELRKAGVWASPHTWMSTLKAVSALHLAAGVGNVCIVEGIPARVIGADFSAYRMRHGHVVMPDAPGFGLALKG